MSPTHEGERPLSATSLLAVLKKHNVQYVVVGSYGAIVQDVDLPLTDLDVVPAIDRENLKHLALALDELEVEEKTTAAGDIRAELLADPALLSASKFWAFSTEYGGLDLVLQPAGFPHGYTDLIRNAKIVQIAQDDDPTQTVEAVVADVRDIYTSKRLARRPKDIAQLPKFANVHTAKTREDVRRRYLQEVAAREQHLQSVLPTTIRQPTKLPLVPKRGTDKRGRPYTRWVRPR